MKTGNNASIYSQERAQMSEIASGKAKGGIARARKLTGAQKSEIAKKAAAARWDEAPMAICGAPDRPLRIGEIEIPCFVLEDERRVLVQSGMLVGLNMKQGTAASRGEGGRGDRLTKFIDTKAVKPFVSNELRNMIMNPIRFRTPSGSMAYGYEATILADLCDVVLDARKSGKMNYQQKHIADQCEILLRGFARVGIVALVDEATGYQEFRQRDALAKILEAFVAKEIQPYLPTFGSDFYREIFRLRGLEFPRDSVKKPQYFGHLTNDIVYARLAPGVLEELKRVTIRNTEGKPKHKLFQRLTSNIGYPKLKEHLGAVVAFMQMSDNWNDFMWKLDRYHPRRNETKMLPFPDDGKGL
jgi:hypothetical protein